MNIFSNTIIMWLDMSSVQEIYMCVCVCFVIFRYISYLKDVIISHHKICELRKLLNIF